MNRNASATHSAAKNSRTIAILAEGGAICAKMNGDRAEPSLLTVKDLCAAAISQLSSALRARLQDIQIVERPGGMLMGRDMHIEQVADLTRRLQELFQQGIRHVIALVSSHAAPCVGAAAAMALRPEYFGHESGAHHPHQQSDASSLVIASSRFPMSDSQGPNAADAVADALEFSLHTYMPGRMGVLFNDKLYAPYHLVRPQDPLDFRSNYSPIASNTDGPRFSQMAREHIPWGTSDEPFIVDSNIKVLSLADDCSNKEEVINTALGLCYGPEAERPSGLVLETVAGGDPIASCQHPEVLSSFNDMNEVPTLVTSRRAPLFTADSNQDICLNRPQSKYEFVESAGELRTPEAKAAFAHWLALFQKGCGTTNVMQFIRQKLFAHPFHS